ncbi:hypothetical protein TraAM80_08005 [Trypanosoma rangeli]|uniref:LysM domain-containing protein n=1 Tax=Trypanosoma rangeli TaxID=5698 RepID=A0A422N2Q5_TRYRA|nr:uncharacterized protein TraAM80_08005 [Trypanosoma rangeli]RNE99741.1 hypothetical protein TraAM80_08005 [Trypanosoma rangeli]|eukprot:RNE99741.1 hypothetical protein TraAM80_08005 [Trypanosoma rangeli]
MDGVQYQIEQLQYALGQLDPHRMLAPEDASQLQMGLANTAAIARRVVERQSRRTFPMRLTGVSVSTNVRPTLPGVSPLATSSSSGEVHRQEPSHALRSDPTSTGVKRSGAGESLPQQGDRGREGECFYETVLTVATQHRVSVNEIRRYNPQLSEYKDEDVLPKNTYIKMKLQMSPRLQYEDNTEQSRVDSRVETRQTHPEATASTELPMPLAPLPATQEALRRPMNLQVMLMRGGEKSPLRDSQTDNTDSPGGPLMQLPSPSPDRVGLSRGGNSTNHVIASELHDNSYTTDINSVHSTIAPEATVAIAAAAATVEGASNYPAVTGVFKGRLSARSPAEVNSAAFEAASNSLCALKLAKPPLTQRKSTVSSANTHTISRYTNPLWAGDRDHSFTTDSSSFHSTPTPTPTPNVSPQPNKKKNLEESARARRGGLVPTLPPPSSLETKSEWQTMVPAAEALLEDSSFESKGLSPIAKTSPQPIESDDEYDTLNSIALKYNVTIKVVLQWNPYLMAYEADDPLPANLPILLPVPQKN